jgi:hypothetical protein
LAQHSAHKEHQITNRPTVFALIVSTPLISAVTVTGFIELVAQLRDYLRRSQLFRKLYNLLKNGIFSIQDKKVSRNYGIFGITGLSFLETWPENPGKQLSSALLVTSLTS